MDETIYNFFTQIALEYNCHMITAIQTNREGSKVNHQRRGVQNRLIVMEDVQESWGAMTTATNVVSVTRDDEAEARHRQTYHVCKSRANQAGQSIVTKTNFAVCRTHGKDLARTSYVGTATMDEKIDGWLQQYNGGTIPREAYMGI